MSMITSANLDVANTTVTTAVNDIFKPDAPDTWKQFCTPIPAAGTSIEIVAVDGLPRVRERVGALQHGNLRAYKKNLAYRQWEGTFDLPRILVDNDQSGAVGQRVAEWPSVIATYTEDIVIAALLANSITGYDGEPLLDAAHPNANAGAGADNLETAALTWAIMRTVMDAQGQLATETGLPLNIRSNTLLVGSANRRVARELAGPMRPTAIGDSSAVDAATGRGALGFNNYDGQELNVIESPYIGGIEYIFMDLTKPTKPMLLAEFTKFRTLSQLTEASDGVYERDTYSWSIQGDVAPCPMAWQLAHGSVTAS